MTAMTAGRFRAVVQVCFKKKLERAMSMVDSMPIRRGLPADVRQMDKEVPLGIQFGQGAKTALSE